MNAKRHQAKRLSSKQVPVWSPAPMNPDSPTPETATGTTPTTAALGSSSSFARPESSSNDDLTQVAVAPTRFVDAARAAFEAGAAYRPPHLEMLQVLERRFDAPTSTGVPDPLAPVMLTLARTLFGESLARWEEATAAFRRHYLQGSDAGLLADTHEVDAAVLRWRAFLCLVYDAASFFSDWCKEQPPCLHDRHSFFQEAHRATALVYAAAEVELWRDNSRPLACDDRYVPKVDLLVAAVKTVEASLSERGVDAHTISVIGEGLFEPRLIASKAMLSALAQQFLAFLLIRVGTRGADPAQTYEIRADVLAEWAQVDLHSVYEAFAGSEDADGPLARELRGRRTILPDWRWAGLADADPLVLPWFDAPPRHGKREGCPWLEVTVNRELWPYLRRLCLYLDRLPLTASGQS